MIRSFIVIIFAVLIGFAGQPWSNHVHAGAWKVLPMVTDDSESVIDDFVVDEKGVPWVVVKNTLYSWNEKNWDEKMKAGKMALYSGLLTGTYLKIDDFKKKECRIWRLLGQDMGIISKFAIQPKIESRLYISWAGDLFYINEKGIACYVKTGWISLNFPFLISTGKKIMPSVADFGSVSTVVFFIVRPEAFNLWDGKQFYGWTPLPKSNGVKAEQIRSIAWGQDRLFFWVQEYARDIRVVQFSANGLIPYDIKDILKKVGDDTRILDARTLPDESVLLTVVRYTGAKCDLIKILPDGTVIEIGNGTLQLNKTMSYGSDACLQTYDSHLWIGTKKGVARISNDYSMRLYSDSDGLSGTNFSWIFSAEEGEIYAASAARNGRIYHWSEKRSAKKVELLWEEIIDVTWLPPVSGPDGNLWVFQKDQPLMASVYDGVSWRYIPVPFDTARVWGKVADDRDHLIVVTDEPEKTVWIVGETEARHVANFPSALVERVKQGVRRFKCHNMFGPIVTDDGKNIWFAGHDSKILNGYIDGKWQTFDFVDSKKKAKIIEDLAFDSLTRQLTVKTWGNVWRFENGAFIKLPRDFNKKDHDVLKEIFHDDYVPPFF